MHLRDHRVHLLDVRQVAAEAVRLVPLRTQRGRLPLGLRGGAVDEGETSAMRRERARYRFTHLAFAADACDEDYHDADGAEDGTAEDDGA
ncbi:hypothetical protein rosag_48600 [Roseisolibacter agri]|uniref:Uncharacterized protein n=1 Tax=Roseisolibacter agri TaxID=2014610 RepID=A0AA37V4T6_9BACT|nr:hypothetical protein rosag_48600 [Roseisolibacter agri]